MFSSNHDSGSLVNDSLYFADVREGLPGQPRSSAQSYVLRSCRCNLRAKNKRKQRLPQGRQSTRRVSKSVTSNCSPAIAHKDKKKQEGNNTGSQPFRQMAAHSEVDSIAVFRPGLVTGNRTGYRVKPFKSIQLKGETCLTGTLVTLP